jgi:flavin reductase (DIM6/NTAB) family NADH-FMN oxidoreductase RutF
VYSLTEIFNDNAEHTATNVIGRVVNFHVNEAVLDDSGSKVDIHKLRPVGRAGGNVYTTIGEGIDMPRPRV